MPAVFSEDAYNRYRITHPDKDLRPLLRRIHKLPLSSSPSSSTPTPPTDLVNQDDAAFLVDEGELQRERELTRIEALKWKLQVERLMACARNLERQGERYKRRAEETTRRAAELEATLEDEKRLLVTKLKERDHMIRCDEVYARIIARSKSKEELEDQITTLQAQIETHRSSHTSYLEIVQRRVDAFAAISPIVDEVKTMKLPAEVFPDTITEDTSMDIDPTPTSSEPSASLSGAALPFQPTTTTSTRNTPAPPPSSRAASHALPHRPSRKSPSIPTAPSGRQTGSRATSASLPQRPSGLRSSATPGRNLEEGEVEGEEGEVDDRKLRGGRRR